MEDVERKNAMQYMLMVYLDENRRAKMKGKFSEGYGEFRQSIVRNDPLRAGTLPPLRSTTAAPDKGDKAVSR